MSNLLDSVNDLISNNDIGREEKIKNIELAIIEYKAKLDEDKTAALTSFSNEGQERVKLAKLNQKVLDWEEAIKKAADLGNQQDMRCCFDKMQKARRAVTHQQLIYDEISGPVAEMRANIKELQECLSLLERSLFELREIP